MRIRLLSRVRVHERCPKCSSLQVHRTSKPSEMHGMGGETLYSLSESCIMCGWSTATPNVKIGA